MPVLPTLTVFSLVGDVVSSVMSLMAGAFDRVPESGPYAAGYSRCQYDRLPAATVRSAGRSRTWRSSWSGSSGRQRRPWSTSSA